MKRLVAIDPSIRSCGVAIFEDGVLVRGELVRHDGEGDLATRIVQMAFGIVHAVNSRGDFSEVVIEYPRTYGGRSTSGDTQDLITLATLVGMVVGILANKHTPPRGTRLVFPQDWKGQTPKDVSNARTIGKLTASEQKAIQPCPKGLRHNIIDAVGIGLFACGR